MYFLDTYINLVKYLQRVRLDPLAGAICTKMQEKLFRNIKDEIIVEIFKRIFGGI